MIIKFFKITIKTIIAITFFVNYLYAANIATLNIEFIMQNNNQYNEYILDFKKKKTNIDKMILNLEKEILKQKNEIEDLQLIMDSKEIDSKIVVYNEKINNFSIKIEKINNEMSNNLSKNENLFINQILNISKNIANKELIDIILSENDYLLSSEDIDISNIIIESLKNYNFKFIYLNDNEIIKN